MILIIVLYALSAITFVLAKSALAFIDPLLFIGLRMSFAGAVLLSWILYKRKTIIPHSKDFLLFAQIVIFHIILSFWGEVWGLQYVSSAKTCLLFSLAPFITALYAMIFLKDRLSTLQWIGLGVGFAGMIPVLVDQVPLEEYAGSLFYFSLPELAILISVISSAYGWILMRKLMDNGYSPLLINGIGMLLGGLASFIVSGFVEGFIPQIYTPDGVSLHYAVLSLVFYIISLIVIGNIVFYNLYGYLLRSYSVTFLSYAGFLSPFFAALFGLIWLGEVPNLAFWLSSIITSIGLYIYYKDTFNKADPV